MIATPEFWAAAGFVALIGVLIYFKVGQGIGASLDKRSERIKTALDEAVQLREEAQQLRETFYNKIKQKRLSQAAIDVLAIVAYNQGITRDDVNQLRDRSSGAILSQLVRRKVLRIQQAEEKPRKPRYFTGDRFLDLFGLETIDDLPQTYDHEKIA